MRAQPKEISHAIFTLRESCNHLAEKNLKETTEQLIALRKKYPIQDTEGNLCILHHIILKIAHAPSDKHYNLMNRLLKNLLSSPSTTNDFTKELAHKSENHDNLTPLAFAEKLSCEFEGMETTVLQIKNAALEKTVQEKETTLAGVKKQLADEEAWHATTSDNYIAAEERAKELQKNIIRAEKYIAELEHRIANNNAKFDHFIVNSRALYEDKRIEVLTLEAQLAEYGASLTALLESHAAIAEENARIWAISEQVAPTSSAFFTLKPTARNIPDGMLVAESPQGNVYRN